MPDQNQTILEGVRLLFRNFSGRETQYNRAGNREFNVLLTPELAEQLSADGWNVKTTRERELDEGEMTGGEPILPVTVGYSPKSRPPLVVLITSKNRTNLTEDEISMLDYAEIVNCDLIIRPYDWLFNGKSGRKAYLKSIYVTINQDPLEEKYADIPMAGYSPSENNDV